MNNEELKEMREIIIGKTIDKVIDELDSLKIKCCDDCAELIDELQDNLIAIKESK